MKKSNVIYCNCCGRKICDADREDRSSFLTIRKVWGYFSDQKDGSVHSMDICESCYDRLVQGFAIAPEIEPVTELL